MTVFKKGGLLSAKHNFAVKLVVTLSAGTKIYIYTTGGRGTKRFYKFSDYAPALDVLDLFNLPYKRGNDAPRGGKNGEFFRISEQVRLKLLAIYQLF